MIWRCPRGRDARCRSGRSTVVVVVRGEEARRLHRGEGAVVHLLLPVGVGLHFPRPVGVGQHAHHVLDFLLGKVLGRVLIQKSLCRAQVLHERRRRPREDNKEEAP
jgi:hypothetical protein